MVKVDSDQSLATQGGPEKGRDDDPSVLPKRDPTGINVMREEIALQRSTEVARGEQVEAPGEKVAATPNEPDRLMSLYLTGKITQGELDFKLRVYNSVVADNLIRDTKNNPTRPNTYTDVPQAKQVQSHAEANTPKSGPLAPKPQGGLLGPSMENSDPEQQRRIKEQQKEQREEQRQNVIQTTLFEKEANEVKNAHAWREMHRQEELERERGSHSLAESEDRLESLSRASKGTTEQIRKRHELSRAEARERALERSHSVNEAQNSEKFWIPKEFLDEIDKSHGMIRWVLRKEGEFLIMVEERGGGLYHFTYFTTREDRVPVSASLVGLEELRGGNSFLIKLMIEGSEHLVTIDLSVPKGYWNGVEAALGLMLDDEP